MTLLSLGKPKVPEVPTTDLLQLSRNKCALDFSNPEKIRRLHEVTAQMSITTNWLNQLRSFKQSFLFEANNYQRLISNAWASSNLPIVNDKEIRVSGLQRSGNHAIIGWIRAHHPTNSRHLNNCPPHQNPYQYLYRHYRKPELAQASKGIFQPYKLLLISYENRPLSEVASRQFKRFHDVYVGCSREQYDLLILRDPFNLMASQLKAGMCNLTDGSAQAMMELWLSYAQEFVGNSQYLDYDRVNVNFNRWHQDSQYRQQLVERLGFEFTDAGREQVRDYGGGSSFDQKSMNHQGSKMDVLNRWRIFETEEKFWQLFQSPQVLAALEQIFACEDLPLHHVSPTQSITVP